MNAADRKNLLQAADARTEALLQSLERYAAELLPSVTIASDKRDAGLALLRKTAECAASLLTRQPADDVKPLTTGNISSNFLTEADPDV